jgi:hypothetical protein
VTGIVFVFVTAFTLGVTTSGARAWTARKLREQRIVIGRRAGVFAVLALLALLLALFLLRIAGRKSAQGEEPAERRPEQGAARDSFGEGSGQGVEIRGVHQATLR